MINEARNHLRTPFGHQGRKENAQNPRLDCGGLILVAGRALGLTSLEFLGYADFPTDGKFEALLVEHAVDTGESFTYPFRFSGGEFLPGDLVAFDYGNGEGVRHIALVTKFDGRRFWVIDAQSNYGVSEHPLAFPFVQTKTVLRRFGVKDLADG